MAVSASTIPQKSHHGAGGVAMPHKNGAALQAQLGAGSVPSEKLPVDRRECLRALHLAAKAMFDGHPVPTVAANRIASAFMKYLNTGGDLERLLGVKTEQGSHDTVPKFWRKICVEDGLIGDEDNATERLDRMDWLPTKGNPEP